MPRVIADRYELLELLGRGGTSAVWRARDDVLGREVAIKEVVPPDGLADDQAGRVYARTIREAKSAARLDHPGIVPVYDVVVEDGRPWIVMRLVRARSLGQIIEAGGPLPPARAAAIGLHLLEALRAAHAAGVVHRGVEPGNVLLPPGRAVLTGFAVAAIAGDADDGTAATVSDAVSVTQSTLTAPELAAGHEAAPASDMWSLGATLYRAVEGRTPEGRPDERDETSAPPTGDPGPGTPRHAGPLAPVLQGLLRADPRQRLGPEEAGRLLRRAAGQDPDAHAAPPVLPGDLTSSDPPFPDTAPGPDAPARSPDAGRLLRRWTIAAAGVLLVTAAATGVAVLGSGDAERRSANANAETSGNDGPSPSASTASPRAEYEPYQTAAFVVSIPKGWKAEPSEKSVRFTPRGRAQGAISIQRLGMTSVDPATLIAAMREDIEGDRSEYPGYKEESYLPDIEYKGERAAELTFSYETVVPFRSRVRMFLFDGALYQVTLLASQKQWASILKHYEMFLKTFRSV